MTITSSRRRSKLKGRVPERLDSVADRSNSLVMAPRKITKDLSAQLADIRLKAGLTQERLALLVGVSQSLIARYESGSRDTTEAFLAEVRAACELEEASAKRRAKGSSEAHTKLVHEIWVAVNSEPDVSIWKLTQGAARPGHGNGHIMHFGLVPGAADLVGLVAPHGRLLAIEAKTGAAKPSARQRAWGERVRKLGGVYVLAGSVDDAMGGVIEARS
jgi:transcriptional regulator with XRE-family HTH domain